MSALNVATGSSGALLDAISAKQSWIWINLIKAVSIDPAFTLMPAESSILTVEYKLNLMAPGDGELLISRAQVIKPGRTLTICRPEVLVVKNRVETLCATALMTLVTLHGKPDRPREIAGRKEQEI